ncbi:alpha-glucuronidase [Cellulomonas cellasea]|uniref:Xylan alpha-(1->2)-glucuronosidase n=1 Tax=Cellulomonas cellasea TaxID=43670 RepID=A0A4Y3KV23_9CELL|nr:alpha-glucuronidase [Cellulomonas cellasea]GEA87962.1 xylan alpha-(1->2)-glucuronosidase [Cellulomonas cellasea]
MSGPTTSPHPTPTPVHPAWLPDATIAPLGTGHALLLTARDETAADPVLATVETELRRAARAHGGRLSTRTDGEPGPDVRLVLATTAVHPQPLPGDAAATEHAWHALVRRVLADPGTLPPESFRLVRDAGVTVVAASSGTGLLHGLHHVARDAAARPGRAAEDTAVTDEVRSPAQAVRMLDHWDNVDVHDVMGQVERGYAGGSLFFADGALRDDLGRAEEYARLLGSIGINRVGLNNVNVHAREARLLTEGLPDVVRLAAVFRPHGIRVHLSVSFAAPMTVGGLPTADPLDPGVQRWWADVTAHVYRAVPDFGGYVVKADSEGQPGPFAYGRDHADGANLLARALAPFGGTVFWRAFVYDHHQDWRDRSTDRARAAHDHFAPLDGRFDENVVLQVKHGPLDFQTREAVSPVIAAMPRTRLAVELQVTQEYTGQQRHACYLAPWWREILDLRPWGEGPTVADVAIGDGPGGRPGALVAVSNVGDDPFWTGHPLAQANLYAFGRLAWDPTLAPEAVLDEWVGLTFGADPDVRAGVHAILDDSWRTYESYTAPLGVGFMVTPGSHYGPSVDGYEYSPWGTYHFADRDGIGVDRTRATGTGYTGQYPAPWRDVYEDLATCPDELLLFFHHVPWGHVLHSGSTVVQHVYDTHFAGVERVEEMVGTWAALAGRVPEDVHARVSERLDEQLRSAREWRDQLTTYVFRKCGVPDARGRRIY